ncbi:MAG: type IV pili methyl-accepting chemotaxis transducer N-terminal domain-containing protein [Cytophagales bacterium]
MDELSPKQEPWKRLSRLYLTALVLIAFFTVLSQFIIQNAVKDLQFDSKIVNLSGRQRFQSQGMVKIVLILTNSEIKLTQEEKKYYLERLERFITNWDKHHFGLMTGNMPEHNYHTNNSKEIKELFEKAHPRYEILSRNIHRILDSVDIMPKERAYLSRDSILDHEFIFLDTMDEIVYQYDFESMQKVERIKKIEIYIVVATLFVLLLEGLFIFRPAVIQIKTSFIKILESERHTKFLYDELEKAYNNLKNTELKLAENEKKKLENELLFKKERSLALVMGKKTKEKELLKICMTV